MKFTNEEKDKLNNKTIYLGLDYIHSLGMIIGKIRQKIKPYLDKKHTISLKSIWYSIVEQDL